ncbi:hypothetical protein QBC47DRAFT_377640 [Echria macrotheca]|uniref:Uncharacterized protein n=1 Tax=Echria macrotheca TaxID=438768 RepID=A0AAJ0BEG0_9PEZI|nr:hypothetical protein QBC47DRAFT_377640 [Echria macrotheca]
MHAPTLFVSFLLALGASAIPTPESTTVTTATTAASSSNIPNFEINSATAFDLPAAPQLAARDVTGLMRLCTDFNGQGRCADVTIPSGAITTNPVAVGLSAFEIDGGQVCNLLGGCPSSAKIVSPGLDCGLGDSFSVFTGCGFGQQHLDSLTGFVNFQGSLNDNLRCIQCSTFF